jgi:hypothetical protein
LPLAPSGWLLFFWAFFGLRFNGIGLLDDSIDKQLSGIVRTLAFRAVLLFEEPFVVSFERGDFAVFLGEALNQFGNAFLELAPLGRELLDLALKVFDLKFKLLGKAHVTPIS